MKQWTRDRGSCKGCGTTEIRHYGFGYCTTCKRIHDDTGKWPSFSQRGRGCATEGCDRPHSARGWCKIHYCRCPLIKGWKNDHARYMYRTDEATRRRMNANSKRWQMNHEEAYEKANEWRRRNPKMAARSRKKSNDKYHKKHGCCRGSRFVPERGCVVTAGRGEVEARLASVAYRGKGLWLVWVLLPWGEKVEFKTNEVRVL